MGTYHYTLRSETKIVDGIEIGRYDYGYKESSSMSWYPGSRARRVRCSESHAENAQWKNRKVRHFVMASSFKEATEEGYFVFELRADRDMPPLSTSGTPGEVVGYLRKVKGRYVFIRKHTALAPVVLGDALAA